MRPVAGVQDPPAGPHVAQLPPKGVLAGRGFHARDDVGKRSGELGTVEPGDVAVCRRGNEAPPERYEASRAEPAA